MTAIRWVREDDGRKYEVLVGLARQAAAAAPSETARWSLLGRTLLSFSDFRTAGDELLAAAPTLPPSAELRLLLSRAFEGQRRFDEALAQIELSLAIEPENLAAQRFHIHLLANMGRLDKAALDSAAVLSLVSSEHSLMEQRTRAIGPQAALALCDAVLAEHPSHGDAQYLKALALARLGRSKDARGIIALETRVAVTELPPAPGHADIGSFCAALAREIRANPTLAEDPRGLATIGGRQTGKLRQPDAPAVESLIVQIRGAIDEYCARNSAADDFFARARPRAAKLSIWAVIYNRDGRQISHRHPGGWLSGVYYVTAPRPPGSNAYLGRLLLGALEDNEGIADPPWGRLEIEPVPGRLVLFPSFTPHATAATGVDDERISVAFDVVPADPRNAIS